MSVPATNNDAHSQTSSAFSYSAYLSKEKLKPASAQSANTPAKVENCLEGLKFVVTGEYDLVSRSKVEQLIKENGGRLVTGVSKAIDYLIVGRILSDGRPAETSKKF